MKARILFYLAAFLVPAATLVTPDNTLAVDLNGDGLHELFVWNGSTDGEVTVFNNSGESISKIAIPATATEDSPILFRAQKGETPIVFSLRLDDTNTAELIAFSSEGRDKKIDLGKLKDSTVIIADYDGNGSSDILYSDSSRHVRVIFDPLEPNTSAQSTGIRIKKKERFGLFGANRGIARYGIKKKKTRRITLQENGRRSKLSGRVPKNSLLLPLYASEGISDQYYGAEVTRKNKSIKAFFYNVLSRQKQTFTSTSPVAPGYFLETSENIPQIATLNGSRIDFYNVTDTKNSIGSTQLQFGSLPPAFPESDLPPGENPSTPRDCIEDFPKETLDRAIRAFKNQDIGKFQAIMGTIYGENYCPEIKERVSSYLVDNLRSVSFSQRSATIPTSLSLLGAPIYSSGAVKKKRAGCDKIRTSDGANGSILKASDHGGDLVTLSPGTFNSRRAELVRPNGKLIEKLKYTGVSNFDHTGARGTFRGSKPPNQYPRHLIVKFYVNEYYGGDNGQAWCFETKNSHVRND